MNHYLKAKVQAIRVTGCEADYQGSLTLDENMMDALGVTKDEVVYVNAKHKKVRIKTYLIPGERGSLQCGMNGAAAQYFKTGDIVHLNFYETVFPNQHKDPIIL